MAGTALECAICVWNPHPPCYRRAKHTLATFTDHTTSCTTPHNARTYLAHCIRYALLHCRVHLDRLSGRDAPNVALHHADRGASAHGESKIVVIHQGKVEIGPLQVHKRPHSQRWVSTCSRAGWAGARARRADRCATAWTHALPTCSRPPLECNESPCDAAPNLRCVNIAAPPQSCSNQRNESGRPGGRRSARPAPAGEHGARLSRSESI